MSIWVIGCVWMVLVGMKRWLECCSLLPADGMIVPPAHGVKARLFQLTCIPLLAWDDTLWQQATRPTRLVHLFPNCSTHVLGFVHKTYKLLALAPFVFGWSFPHSGRSPPPQKMK